MYIWRWPCWMKPFFFPFPFFFSFQKMPQDVKGCVWVFVCACVFVHPLMAVCYGGGTFEVNTPLPGGGVDTCQAAGTAEDAQWGRVPWDVLIFDCSFFFFSLYDISWMTDKRLSWPQLLLSGSWRRLWGVTSGKCQCFSAVTLTPA